MSQDLLIRNNKLRVCYFGTYRSNYSRNQMMIAGLRENGVEVMECHETLWQGIEDRVNATTGGWRHPAFWKRVIQTYMRLLQKYFKTGDYDILIVGYPGQFDIFLARLLSWIKRKPLVWDVFMSIYLIALERGLDTQGTLTVKSLRILEWLGLHLPDLLIQDTSEYVAWFEKTYRIDKNKFQLVPTGADDRVFQPLPSKSIQTDIFCVIYYGTFIPNHGVQYIIEAARILKGDSTIRFELIGTGPDQEKARELSKNHNLQNVKFIEWLEKPALLERIAQTDVCLGAFGTTPQSLMTVQNKVYEGLAMHRPVITGDSNAVRQNFQHGKNIFLCERASGSSLAEAILRLKNNSDLCQKIAENGYQVFLQQFDLEHNGQRFKEHLIELTQR